MTASVRFLVSRFTNELMDQAREIEREIDVETKEIARKVADRWSNKIRRSGRGGAEWNSRMASIETSFTGPKSGSLNVRMGWLGSPPMAKDGKTTWFVYQDKGYNMFGNPARPISGIMAQIDARRELKEGLEDLKRDIIRSTEKRIGRL